MSTKSRTQLEGEIAEALARSTRGARRFGGWHVPGVRPGTYGAHFEAEVFPKTRRAPARRPDPRRPSLGPGPRSLSERQIHPETFAVLDRSGKILGTSRSVKGAMARAPEGRTYATVRGEYTSDGTSWGVGRGRIVATREHRPEHGLRWYVESYQEM